MKRVAYHKLRDQKGSLGILIPSSVLLLVLGVGAFSADIAHNVTVRAQLQNATDAGALAGAASLADPDEAYNAAYNAALLTSKNSADGTPVSATTPNTNVQVSIELDGQDERGTCTVTATQPIQNWLASMFGHSSDTISVTSTAAASLTVNRIASNILFPLAVSLDAVPTSKTVSQLPLSKLKVGDKFYIYINSQQIKNGAFTSFVTKDTNANWLNDAIDQSLGFKAPKPDFIPTTRIGENIYLINGVAGQKSLADDPRITALTERDHFVLPVIEGTPPFNQSRPVIGWVVVKIKGVEKNKSGGEVETIETEITNAAVRGEKGEIFGASNGDAEATKNLTSMSPSFVRLIPNKTTWF